MASESLEEFDSCWCHALRGVDLEEVHVLVPASCTKQCAADRESNVTNSLRSTARQNLAEDRLQGGEAVHLQLPGGAAERKKSAFWMESHSPDGMIGFQNLAHCWSTLCNVPEADILGNRPSCEDCQTGMEVHCPSFFVVRNLKRCALTRPVEVCKEQCTIGGSQEHEAAATSSTAGGLPADRAVREPGHRRVAEQQAFMANELSY
mmetsp:Transcript_154938/g.289023  ORF Transcript_154938/g.289023 Transcript_154938/m.289023 type:complete len:206 (+) Transcript_154938:824-1441(+)